MPCSEAERNGHMIENIQYYRNHNCTMYPKIVQIEITNRCPLNCPQCYKDILEKDIKFSDFTNIIDECEKMNVGSIMLNGGEPMIHPQIVDMIRYISSKNINTYCFLSGVALNEDKIEKLSDCKICISISLNGINPEINRLSRDGYQNAINAINLLKNSSILWGINWVARHDNIGDFENLIDYAVKQNAKFINVIANKIHGTELLSPMDKDDYALLKNIILSRKNVIDIRIESCFSILSAYMGVRRPQLYKGCGAGIFVCYVNVDNEYFPCSHLQYPERFSSLSEYWENSKVLKLLRDVRMKDIEPCRDCINHLNCRFCKAVSFDTSRDFNVGFQKCPIMETELRGN